MSGPGCGKKELPSILGKERKLDPGSTGKQQEQDCKQGDSMGMMFTQDIEPQAELQPSIITTQLRKVARA